MFFVETNVCAEYYNFFFVYITLHNNSIIATGPKCCDYANKIYLKI